MNNLLVHVKTKFKSQRSSQEFAILRNNNGGTMKVLTETGCGLRNMQMGELLRNACSPSLNCVHPVG